MPGMHEQYDIIIIGSGPGGGTLALKLAPTGKKILILERGEYLVREKQNWNTKSVFIDERYTAEERWYDKKDKPFRPGIHYFVGGNSKMYGAALFRFRESDFIEVKHADGISPAWPISYADLAPYYLEAEKIYHVHGERGADPTEPPEAHPYFYPAIKNEPRIQRLYDDLKSLGHKPFPLPMGLILNEEDMVKSPCIRCNTCDGFPCLIDAKADAQVVAVDPALEYPNVTLLTGRHVLRLVTDPSGKVVTTVIATHEGKHEEYSGNIIVVSCGAIQSAVLLLNSANDKHPKGLANGSDAVGRHYMCHNNSAFVALSMEENPTVFQKTIGLNDYYHGADDWDFPLGHIQMLGKSDGEMFKGDAPPFTPKTVLNQMARHALDFWLTTEDLPDPNNRVLLRNGKTLLHYTDNNVDAHNRLVKKLKDILKAIGGSHSIIPRNIFLSKKIPLAGTAHQNGTVRFGTDPTTSALDIHCKAHELDNLYVVDGSFFPSSAAVNPALTIAANALRVGDHLAKLL